MKKLALTAILFASATFAADVTLVPTGSVSGTVTVKSGSSSDVPVYVSGTSLVGYTNSAGAFTITNVPVGSYTITASAGGSTASATVKAVVARVGDVISAGTISLEPASSPEKDLLVSAEDKYAKNQYSAARSDFQQITGSASFGEIAKYRIGVSYYLENNYDQAITELNKVNKSGQFGGKAAYYIGRATRGKGDESGAETLFKAMKTTYSGTDNATDAQLQIEDIVTTRGYNNFIEGKYSAAIADLQKFIDENPTSKDFAMACYYLGKSYSGNEDAAKAIAVLSKIQTNNPRYLDAMVEIVKTKSSFAGYTMSEAAADNEKIISADSKSFQARWAADMRAKLKWDMGDSTGAITAWETALSSFSANTADTLNAYYSLGYKNYLKMNYAKAITWFDAYAKKCPSQNTSADCYYYSGKCHEKLAVNALSASDPEIVKAKASYNTIITTYKNSSRVADAQARLKVLP